MPIDPPRDDMNEERDQLLPLLLRRAAQCVTDGDGTILWANRDFAERFGYEPVALAGKEQDDVIGTRVDASGHRACRRKDGSTFRALLRRSRVRSNGSTLMLWTLGRPGRALATRDELEDGRRADGHELDLDLLRVLHELASS